MRDLIIDCFAGGGGASVGIEMALGRSVDIAINHDPQAIRMHKTNHPTTLHLTEDIFQVDLPKYVKGRHVALMWASPDCTSHSKAKGSKPKERGLRILPWAVHKHAAEILPDVIIMENVEEIRQWGPLNKKGHPIAKKKGKEYRKFLKKMYLLGYTKIETRILVAADHGVPTTRKRWHAILRRDGKPIVWPEPTHNRYGTDGLQQWEPIWKHLDLMDVGNSIFGRKKPLAEKTMDRIARGIEKFVFNSKEPFIIQVNHGCERFRGQSIHDPMPTITQKNGMGLVSPYIMQIGHTGFSQDRNRSVTDSLSTIVTKNEHCLISPLLIQYHSETTRKEVRGQAVTDPIMTLDTSNRYALIMSYLTKFYKSGSGQSLYEPIHTITTSPGHFGHVSILAIPKEQLFASINKNNCDPDQVNDVIQKCTWVSQFIMEYYGCGTGQSLHDPLHTVVTKDRFALVTVLGNEFAILDIFLRMLKAEPELKRGQGFPEDYIITHDYAGKKFPVHEQVAKLGNSVSPMMAQILVEANCSYLRVGERMPNMKVIESSNGQLRLA